MSRSITPVLLTAAGLVMGAGAQAVGFGRVTPSATLGLPLDLRVPLMLEPGETLDEGCIAAEVRPGETRLPPAAVRVSVEGQGPTAVLRVRTLAPIDDLVVEVTVSAGCSARFTRTYTAFPDPPRTVPIGAAPETPAAEAAPGAAAPMAAAPLTPAAPPPLRGTPTPRAPRAERESTAARNTPASRPSTSPRVANAARPAGALRPAAQDSRSRLVLEPLVSRLRLDLSEPDFDPAAAVAAAPPASTAQEQLAALEGTLKQLREQRSKQQADAARAQADLARARDRSEWVPWLVALAALLLVAVGGLAWRLRQAARSATPWWNGAEPAPVAAPLPAAAEPPTPALDDPALAAPPVPVPALTAAAAAASLTPVPEEPPAPRAEPNRWDGLPAEASGPLRLMDEPARREVAVEELLDLEQQTEFYVALGQEDAAIELLTTHLRGTGGWSPVPYVQLLDLYRQRGDFTAFEGVADRFTRQFQADMPAWQVSGDAPAGLDDHPATLKRLQTLWPQPAQAVAALESLLLRLRPDDELFDWPSYRDVLLLYSVARDLAHPVSQIVQDELDVDVLLPLSDTDELRAALAQATNTDTQPAPFSDTPAAPPRPMLDLELAPVERPRPPPADR